MKNYATVGDLGSAPRNHRYIEVTDIAVRAAVVAHLIRIGNRPSVGMGIGFSRQLRQGDEEEAISASGEIDLSKCVPVTEKIWCHITVTQIDIDAAHAIINAQKITYREAGGKVSQMFTGKK